MQMGLPMTTAPPAMPPATAPMATPGDLEVGGEGGSTVTGLGLGLVTAGTVTLPGTPATITTTFTSVKLMLTPATHKQTHFTNSNATHEPH